MQTILALIVAYLVFVTRTWAITRLVVLIDVGFALLAATLVLWSVNLVLDRNRPRPGGFA